MKTLKIISLATAAALLGAALITHAAEPQREHRFHRAAPAAAPATAPALVPLITEN